MKESCSNTTFGQFPCLHVSVRSLNTQERLLRIPSPLSVRLSSLVLCPQHSSFLGLPGFSAPSPHPGEPAELQQVPPPCALTWKPLKVVSLDNQGVTSFVSGLPGFTVLYRLMSRVLKNIISHILPVVSRCVWG